MRMRIDVAGQVVCGLARVTYAWRTKHRRAALGVRQFDGCNSQAISLWVFGPRALYCRHRAGTQRVDTKAAILEISGPSSDDGPQCGFRGTVGYGGLYDLDLRHAPIDGEIHASDERTFIRGEEHNGGRNFLGLAPATEWNLRGELGSRALGLLRGKARGLL